MPNNSTQNELRTSEKIISKLREFYDLDSDTALALKLGKSQSTIASWKSRDSVDYKLIITKCNDIDLNWLFRDKSTTSVKPNGTSQGGDPIRLQGEIASLQTQNALLTALLEEKDRVIALLSK